MAEAFIVRRGGGGGSGGTLVVTSSGAGTVTVSNTVLGKSYSKSVTAGGSVTFKGLKTGEWTVTLSNGTQTTTKSVTVNADYSVSLAYFSATISVTYPAKSKCVVKNSGGQTVASDTNTGSSTKTWTATVGATGTYTVTATATDGSGKTKSTTVNITTEGQVESVKLSYVRVLYNAGDQYTAVTGGYSARNSDVTFASSAIQVSVENGGYNTWAWTNKAIDVTGYSTLRVYAHPASQYYRSMRFGVASSVNTSSCNFTAYSDAHVDAELTPQCDISDVSGDMYIVPCFGGALGTSGGLWANITKVEIE